jgi:magnesium chelatase family protein
LRHTDGVLPMVSIARKHGIETVYVPYDDAPEAGLLDGATVIPIRTLADLAAHLSGERPIAPYLAEATAGDDEMIYLADFKNIKGQEHVMRALEVATAEDHDVGEGISISSTRSR